MVVYNAFLQSLQILSLESWLAVSLDNSEAIGEDIEGDESSVPKFEPVQGLKCLHSHVAEAASQMEETMDDDEGSSENNREVGETKQVWDLMMALWGKLEGNLNYENFALISVQF